MKYAVFNVWTYFSLPFVLKSESHEEDDLTKEYEIYATVAHIKDAKTAGNLVSSVKVGKTYHQRKEKVTCSQWYLFNDFAITPIELVSIISLQIHENSSKKHNMEKIQRKFLLKHYNGYKH